MVHIQSCLQSRTFSVHIMLPAHECNIHTYSTQKTLAAITDCVYIAFNTIENGIMNVLGSVLTAVLNLPSILLHSTLRDLYTTSLVYMPTLQQIIGASHYNKASLISQVLCSVTNVCAYMRNACMIKGCCVHASSTVPMQEGKCRRKSEEMRMSRQGVALIFIIPQCFNASCL